jgi:predicted enzyme related to lactoylglutathione lyase
LGEITLDCSDPARVARFWSVLFECPERAGDDGWYEVGPIAPGGPKLNFQPVPEPKVSKARVHLDLWVDDLGGGMALVEEMGGRRLEEVRTFPQGRVIVMADPEGTEFCLVALPA